MSELLLQTENFGCERDERVLFSALNWQASAGEIWQIAGDNGAGKTTLLRILAGLYGFYEGTFYWPKWNKEGSKAATDAHQYSLYLGHKTGLREELTALENLNWWQALHGHSVDPMSALARLGLAGYETVPCASLSAGQKRRVALSLLWLMDKPVWLLDEPFTALDADGVTLIEQRIKAHAVAGGLVIYSSHHRFDETVRHVRLGGEQVELA